MKNKKVKATKIEFKAYFKFVLEKKMKDDNYKQSFENPTFSTNEDKNQIRLITKDNLTVIKNK